MVLRPRRTERRRGAAGSHQPAPSVSRLPENVLRHVVVYVPAAAWATSQITWRYMIASSGPHTGCDVARRCPRGSRWPRAARPARRASTARQRARRAPLRSPAAPTHLAYHQRGRCGDIETLAVVVDRCRVTPGSINSISADRRPRDRWRRSRQRPNRDRRSLSACGAIGELSAQNQVLHHGATGHERSPSAAATAPGSCSSSQPAACSVDSRTPPRHAAPRLRREREVSRAGRRTTRRARRRSFELEPTSGQLLVVPYLEHDVSRGGVGPGTEQCGNVERTDPQEVPGAARPRLGRRSAARAVRRRQDGRPP